jgi:tripartite-type tricarboxylate transporter receptor subunit TctC
MVKTRRALLSSGLLGALAIAAPLRVRGAAWPERPVKFIVPFGPGAGADIGARIFADRLQGLWGRPVIVENRPGGDSIVAITAFLNANDDHTFLFAPAGKHRENTMALWCKALPNSRSGVTRLPRA